MIHPVGYFRRESLALRVWQAVNKQKENAVVVLRWSLPVTRPPAKAGDYWWNLSIEFWVGDLAHRDIFDDLFEVLGSSLADPSWDEVEELLHRHGYFLTEDLPV